MMLLKTLLSIAPQFLPVVNFPDKTNADLMARVTSYIQRSIDQGAKYAPHFAKGDPAKNVFNFLKNEIKYVADEDLQDIQTPDALLVNGVGDCKSFTLFTVGILANLDYKLKVRFAGYVQDSPIVNHVYSIANGIVIDAVPAITRDSITKQIIKVTPPVYNQEAPWAIKQDYILYT